MKKRTYNIIATSILVLGLGIATTALAMPGDASRPPFNPGNAAQPLKQLGIGAAPGSAGLNIASGIAGALTKFDKPNSVLGIFGRLWIGDTTRLGQLSSFTFQTGPYSFVPLPEKILNIDGTLLSTTLVHAGTPAQKPLCVQNLRLMLCEDTDPGESVPIPTYSCAGTTPSNATLCSGDDTGLTANVNKTLVASCSTPKCEYACNPGFTYSGGTCVQSAGFSCTGTVPYNAPLCSGDDTGLTANTARTTVISCTTGAKCEHQQISESVNFVTTTETLSSSDTFVNSGTNPMTNGSISGEMCITGSVLANHVYLPIGNTAQGGNMLYQPMYKDAERTLLFSNNGYIRYYNGSTSTIFKVTNGQTTTTTINCP